MNGCKIWKKGILEEPHAVESWYEDVGWVADDWGGMD
jgi:hypothetical protein